jgi:hypothetical protein
MCQSNSSKIMTPWTPIEEDILRTAPSREQACRTLKLEGFDRTSASVYRKTTQMLKISPKQTPALFRKKP